MKTITLTSLVLATFLTAVPSDIVASENDNESYYWRNQFGGVPDNRGWCDKIAEEHDYDNKKQLEEEANKAREEERYFQQREEERREQAKKDEDEQRERDRNMWNQE